MNGRYGSTAIFNADSAQNQNQNVENGHGASHPYGQQLVLRDRSTLEVL